MANTTDPRFQKSRFQGAADPRKVAAVGRAGGSTEASRKAHAESDRKNQYRHPVVCKKEPTARTE